MKNKPASLTLLAAGLATLALCSINLRASSLPEEAIGWWTFEGNTSGTGNKNLVAVAPETSKLAPVVPMAFEPVSGIGAGNAGQQAVKLDGKSVLKTNDPALRLPGAQTWWLRVKLNSLPAGDVVLMSRSRPLDGSRGLALQLLDGRLVALASTDGVAYDGTLKDLNSAPLAAGKWYDIAMRFDPSNRLRVDVYDPSTGKLVQTQEITVGVPSSVQKANNIGSGYLQIGSINNGSAGSAWSIPDGLIEAAGVWNRSLTDAEVAGLSAKAGQ